MSWNYRVVHQVCDGEDFYTIREVHYGKGHAFAVIAKIPSGTSVDELRNAIMGMLEALDEEVLEIERSK